MERGFEHNEYETKTDLNNSIMNVQIEFQMASYHAVTIKISHTYLFSIYNFSVL